VFVLGKLFQLSLMLAPKDGTLIKRRTWKVFYFRVGSLPCLQALDYAGNSDQEQTLLLILPIRKCNRKWRVVSTNSERHFPSCRLADCDGANLSFFAKLSISVSACGLYYKCFVIVIYNCKLCFSLPHTLQL
jgi:hypothetical protein